MKNIYDWMIKREGVLREKHAARRFSENHEGGRGRSGGAGLAPLHWDSEGHLEPISICQE